MVNNGRKKTPLPVRISHTIYNTCKNNEVITSLNNLGLSISYDELRRCRNKLGAYVIKQDEIGVVSLLLEQWTILTILINPPPLG